MSAAPPSTTGQRVGQAAVVQLGQVVAHHHRRLHQQPRHADDVGVVLLRRGDDRGDRLLDADVHHVIAVVGQDDVDEVLADVVHVAPDRREHDRAAPAVRRLLHVRFEVADRGLHDLRRLEHERELHLPGAEQLAHRLHAVEQEVVDYCQGGPLRQGDGEVVVKALPLAVDDPPLEPLLQRQRGELGGPRRLRRYRVHALEQVEHPRQRVVAGPPPVVDQVHGHLPLLVGDARQRDDLRRGHDGRVEPGLHALGKEHRVEHLAGGRLEPERDVRDPEGRLHVGVAALELGDRLDGLDARPAWSPPGRSRSGR